MKTNIKRKMKLVLKYQGDFYVPSTSATDTQCGSKGQIRYRYEVAICCPNDVVDGTTGFLIDNAEVPKYFANVYKKMPCPSCERVAEKALDHFCDDLHSRELNPNYIMVKILPNEYASIEAYWTKDEEGLNDKEITVVHNNSLVTLG